MTTPLDRLEAVLAAATPGRWFWEATGPGPGDITLSRDTGETDEDPHILTPHVCESCTKHGIRCLAPRTENARAITAAVNLASSLLAVVKAAEAIPDPAMEEFGAIDWRSWALSLRAPLDNLHSAITQEVGE